MSLKSQLETYSNTFQSSLYGTPKLFSIEPKNIQSVFATNFNSWGVEPLRLFVFKPYIGEGIMNTDGTFWEHSRNLIKPMFGRVQIADLSSFSVHVDRLVEQIPKDCSTVDMQPLFARLSLDASTELLFGESVKSLTTETAIDAKAFLASTTCAQAGVGKRMQLPQWNIFTQNKKFWEACKIVHDFVDGHVHKALLLSAPLATTEKSAKYVLSYELAQKTRDGVDIRNQLLNIFMPAHDATAVALTNVFFNLARNVSVWAKLRKDVLALGSSEITFETLKSMKYLQYVVNETFRLNPPIGTISRIALKDTVIPTGGGPMGISPVYMKKGSIFSTSFYALHRRTDIYGIDADKFVPERWEGLRPPPWAYIPFSGGPRVCPAQQLALTWTMYTIVRIMQRFRDIENRDPVAEFVEQYKVATISKNGAKVSLTPA